MNRITFTCFLVLGLPAALQAAQTGRVITRENAIRKECKFFSPVKTKVHQNDVLTILGKSGDWFRVSFKGNEGCIHKGALEQKSFSLSKAFGDSTDSASSDEVALAGKGFNPQVEASYRNSNPQLDFSAVDAIEKYQVTADELRTFLAEGGLGNDR